VLLLLSIAISADVESVTAAERNGWSVADVSELRAIGRRDNWKEIGEWTCRNQHGG